DVQPQPLMGDAQRFEVLVFCRRGSDSGHYACALDSLGRRLRIRIMVLRQPHLREIQRYSLFPMHLLPHFFRNAKPVGMSAARSVATLHLLPTFVEQFVAPVPYPQSDVAPKSKTWLAVRPLYVVFRWQDPN